MLGRHFEEYWKEKGGGAEAKGGGTVGRRHFERWPEGGRGTSGTSEAVVRKGSVMYCCSAQTQWYSVTNNEESTRTRTY